MLEKKLVNKRVKITFLMIMTMLLVIQLMPTCFAVGEYEVQINGCPLIVKNDGTVWIGGSWNSSTYVQVPGLTDIIEVSDGYYHAMALKSDGTVWEWGDTVSGCSSIPEQVIGLNDVVHIAGGYRHSMALKSDGTVWTWGDNYCGELGNGTTIDSNIPIQVLNLEDVVQIAADEHSMAIKGDGTVWTWGSNCCGQLGDGTTVDSNIPVQALNLEDIIQISAGGYHSMALKDDGTVWTWGSTDCCQLGREDLGDSDIPVQIENFYGISKIDAGYEHSLALKSDGTVWFWGGDYYTCYWCPTQVSTIDNATDIAAGDGFSMAILNDKLFTWNAVCDIPTEIDVELYVDCSLPVINVTFPTENLYLGSTLQLEGVVSAAYEGDILTTKYNIDGGATQTVEGTITSSGTFSVTISTSNLSEGTHTLNAWVEDDCGRISDTVSRTFIVDKIAPVVTCDNTDYSWKDSNISVGLSFTDTISGLNIKKYELSTSATPSGTYQSTYSGPITVSTESATNYIHYKAVDNAGNVTTGTFGPYKLDKTIPTVTADNIDYTWNNGAVRVSLNYIDSLSGMNIKKYELSTNATPSGTYPSTYNDPIIVSTESATNYIHYKAIDNVGNVTTGTFGPYELDKTIADIDGGADHSLILKNNGTVWASGDGNGSTYVQVLGLTDIIEISAGYCHSMALKSDGTVWEWGVAYDIPEQVMGLNDVVHIATGWLYSVALKSDGTVWAWGKNDWGQLGNGTTVYSNIPVQVLNLEDVIQIAAGEYHSMAIKGDGTVWAWGDNSYGMLGDGTTVNFGYSNIPVQALNLEDIIQIDAGEYYSMALKDDGTVWTWGSTDSCQLGREDLGDSDIPVQIENFYGIVEIDAGYEQGLALKSDGTIWTWGSNWFGQLGNELYDYSISPIQVSTIDNATIIASGYDFCMAISNDRLFSWGFNEYGNLGDGTTENRYIPTEIDVELYVDCSLPIINVTFPTEILYLGDTFQLEGMVWAAYEGDILTTKYNIDGGATQTVTGTVTSSGTFSTGISTSNLSEGTYTLNAWVEDDYGGISDTVSKTLAVDRSAPTVTCNNTDYSWKNSDIWPVLSITDAISGLSIRKYELSTNETPSGTYPYNIYYTGYIAIITESATNYIHYKAVDNVGNETTGTLGPYKLDKTAPTVTADNTDYTWKNDDVCVSLNYMDSLSGLNIKKYELSTSATPSGTYSSTYSGPITISTESATNYIHYKAMDNAGNEVTGTFGPYKIDKTAPTVTADYTDYTLKNGDVCVSLNYIDSVSGLNIKKYELSTNATPSGTYPSTYNDPIIISTESAANYIHYKAIDNMGNVTTGTFGPYKLDKTIVDFDGGEYHSIILKNNGTVWASGENSYDQLGDGTVYDSSTYVQVLGLTDITEVSAGNYHNMALKSDGTVWEWGDTVSGYIDIPEQVMGLSDVVHIAAGYYYSIALKSDGTVWTWGYNYYGQLGNGTTIDSNIPVQVLNLDDVTQIVAGNAHSMALEGDGTLWTWGYNHYGQLGNGTIINVNIPVQVLNLNDVSQIAAGEDHSMAIEGDGTLWTWGCNDYGQLGNGTTSDSYVPIQIENFYGINEIDAGFAHSLALKSDGTIWTWGENWTGQLGNELYDYTLSPIQVTTIDYATTIAAGFNFSMAISNDKLFSWGCNCAGNLGDGTTTNRTIPTEAFFADNLISVICTKGRELNLAVTVSNITDFSQYAVKISYDKDILEVTDLCGKTTEEELSPCTIEQEGITITEFEEGKIMFTVDKPVEQGYDWTSIINNIIFNAKVTGQTTISYAVNNLSE